MKENNKNGCTYSVLEAKGATWANEPTRVCPICGEEFRGYHYNPWPVTPEGRCCDKCDKKYVTGARQILSLHTETIDNAVDTINKKIVARSLYIELKYMDVTKMLPIGDTDPNYLDMLKNCLDTWGIYFIIYNDKGLKVAVESSDIMGQSIMEEVIQRYLDNYHMGKNLKGVQRWDSTTARRILIDTTVKKYESEKNRVKDINE